MKTVIRIMTTIARNDAAQNEPVLQLAHAPSFSSSSSNSSVSDTLCKMKIESSYSYSTLVSYFLCLIKILRIDQNFDTSIVLALFPWERRYLQGATQY